MKETIRIGGHSGSRQDDRIIQTGIGRKRRQHGKKLAIDCVARGRLVFEDIFPRSLDRHTGLLSSKLKPDAQVERYSRANADALDVRLETVDRDPKYIAVRGNIVDAECASGSGLDVPRESSDRI